MSSLAICEDCATNWWPFDYSGTSDEAKKVTSVYEQDIEALATSVDYGPYKRYTKAIEEIFPIFSECQLDGWDGGGAQAVSEAAFYNAIELYMQLPKEYSSDITPEPDGAIGFEWYLAPYRTLSFSVRGDGSVIFSGLFGINDSEYGDKPLGEKLHPRLRGLLETLFND